MDFFTAPGSDKLGVEIMSENIILIASMLIILLTLRFFIYTVNCNKLYKNVEATLKERTKYFNKGFKITYNDLSMRLKKYITEDEFYKLRTWYDAYNKFAKIPKPDARMGSASRYSFKYTISFTDKNVKQPIYYNVIFTDALLGMKIDYIAVDIPELDIEQDKMDSLPC